jgi:hypothetical protein
MYVYETAVSGCDHQSMGRLDPLPTTSHRITENRRSPRRREHCQHSRPMGPGPPVRRRRPSRYVQFPTHVPSSMSSNADVYAFLALFLICLKLTNRANPTSNPNPRFPLSLSLSLSLFNQIQTTHKHIITKAHVLAFQNTPKTT